MASDFTAQIDRIVRLIPQGKVLSYGQIALLCGRPRAARVVGGAMSRCNAEGVPCHRVVKRDGSLCEGYEFGIAGLQRELLRSEGVKFLPDGRVDIAQCCWEGPGE